MTVLVALCITLMTCWVIALKGRRGGALIKRGVREDTGRGQEDPGREDLSGEWERERGNGVVELRKLL